MVAPCSIARTGIMYYRAGDCGELFAGRDPDSVVKVLTSEEELFKQDSLDSYFSAPVTIGHPDVDVSIHNSSELRKGHLNGTPHKEGTELCGTLVVDDAGAIELIGNGTSELSSGHTCTLRLADADADWDAEKINIRANHIAIVKRGRAGSARIADGDNMKLQELKALLKDEYSIDVDGLLAKVEKAKTKLGDAKTYKEEAEAKLADTVKVQAKLDDVEAKLADALAQVPSQESIDAQVEQRVGFVAQVHSLNDSIECAGKSAIDIKREVVAAKYADINLDDSVYVGARYDIMLEDKALADKEAPVESAMSEELRANLADAEDEDKTPSARDRMIARNSHK